MLGFFYFLAYWLVKSEKTWYFTTIHTTIDGCNMPEAARICHAGILEKPELSHRSMAKISKKEHKTDDKNTVHLPRQDIAELEKVTAPQGFFGSGSVLDTTF